MHPVFEAKVAVRELVAVADQKCSCRREHSHDPYLPHHPHAIAAVDTVTRVMNATSAKWAP